MIIKYYDLNKKLILKNNFFLLYGNNTGQKKEIIENVLVANFTKNITYYEESEIIKNPILLEEKIFNKSFFDNEKLIIINRASEKILKILEPVVKKEINDIKIVITAGILEKKSKLRNFFEKSKETIIIPFYEDNHQTLFQIAEKKFAESKINISKENINLIVSRSNNDRINLKNEIQKIKSYSLSKKNITFDEVIKLTNLAENYSISQLVDNCLIKNKKKTINILNENNQTADDNILILKTFLYKLKRLKKIQSSLSTNNSIDGVLSTFRPPIFWKEKDLIKQQLKYWSIRSIEKLVYSINNLELLIKKNPNISVRLVNNFILENLETSNN